jgi:hypothetical protein
MANKTGNEKEMWDAINAARSGTALSRLNHAELEDVLAFLDGMGWTIAKKPGATLR